MKADFSITNIVHIQVASELTNLLFTELEKLTIAEAPLSAQRVHLTALTHAQAVQQSLVDLLRELPDSPERIKEARQKRLRARNVGLRAKNDVFAGNRFSAS